METPFYLRPTTTDADTVIDVVKATEFKYDYDYGYLPEPQGTKSFWEEIAYSTSEAASNANDFVWDTAKGTWDTVKAGAQAALDEVKVVTTGITDTATSIFDSVLTRILVVFGVIVLGIWLLAKAGVIKDVASVFR